MAALVGRTSRGALLKVSSTANPQNMRLLSFKNASTGKKIAMASVGALTAGGVGFVVALNSSVQASGLKLHPPPYPWQHNGMFSSFDHHAIRRGYEVYKQVCAACHSMDHVCYRDLVGVIFTEAEAKAEAEEAMITDGPDDEGNMFERPGKLTDTFPRPYPNNEAARAANNGALPPDLSYIIRAREGGEDYIFSLLTGYRDCPEGVTLAEGQAYNAYFPGGAIGMAQALYNEIIEYSDGTPATQSQLAKDVTTFLSWSAFPDHDTRKRLFLKFVTLVLAFTAVTFYYKKLRWAYLKTKVIKLKKD